MKVKIEKVTVGVYDYDSIAVKIDGKETEIVFNKKEKIAQYEGKEIELVNDKGVYKIKPAVAPKKND